MREWTEQWVVDQGIEQGLERGIEQGRAQGIERGRVEERALLCRQAARKFDATAGQQLAAALAEVTNPDTLAQVGDWSPRGAALGAASRLPEPPGSSPSACPLQLQQRVVLVARRQRAVRAVGDQVEPFKHDLADQNLTQRRSDDAVHRH